MAWAPERMRFRLLRLIIDVVGLQPHGGPLAPSARFTRRFQPGKAWLVKNLDLQPIPLPLPGRREICTRSSGHPQGVPAQELLTDRRVGPTRRRTSLTPAGNHLAAATGLSREQPGIAVGRQVEMVLDDDEAGGAWFFWGGRAGNGQGSRSGSGSEAARGPQRGQHPRPAGRPDVPGHSTPGFACKDGWVPRALPEGDLAPPSGELPAGALKALGSGPFGIYVHVPFCTVRCGYCDFNTYTLTELGVDGASVGTYADVALRELELATRVLGPMAPTVQTVFFGGGTPTVLAASDLVRVLDGIRTRFGLAERAEVTTEANPDSVTPASLQELAAGRFTRVSMGMQSAVPHVLAALERTHDPVNVAKAVEAAKSAGLKVSLDLIYGTPGESLMDWRTSLDAAIHLGPDHISAYALVVEEGTKLGAQVGRGQVPAPQDDDEAAKY